MHIYTRFQPDNLWIKQITDTGYNIQNHDAIRGASKIVMPNLTSAEATDANAVTAFKPDGWNMNNEYGSHNVVGKDYISKAWRKGVTPGYTVIPYIGNGSNRTIAHDLGVLPELMVIKDLDAAGNWYVWDKWVAAVNSAYVLYMSGSVGMTSDATAFNSTAPTSSVFTVGTSASTNTNGRRYIAHLWTGIKGFSKFGQYIGDAASNGKYIHCGFRPALIWWKPVDTSNMWGIVEDDDNTGNVCRNRWWINSNKAIPPDGIYYDVLDICAQGFKIRWSDAELNASGQRYIYCAWAAAPAKYSRAR